MDDARLKRLQEVAAAYGADPARWPEGERSLLDEAARANPDTLVEAREIDRVLGQATAPKTSFEGRSRLLETIARERQAASANVVAMPVRRPPPRWPWAAAAALAASLACGIYLGSLDSANSLFDSSPAVSDDPVDLAGLGDISDYLEDQS